MIHRTTELGKRVLKKSGLPVHLVLFVTNKCDMRCQHCFLVENGELNDKSRHVMELKDIKNIALSVPKLLALSITGGEPFLRKDLPLIIQAFTDSGYLKTISIISNGHQTDRIIDTTRRILRENQPEVFLSVSLDGDRDTHNTIRNKHGSYSNAMNTLIGLTKLRKRNPHLSIGVNSTYTGSNYQEIQSLYQELESVNLDYASLNLIRGPTWDSKPSTIDINEYIHLSSLKENLIQPKRKTSSLINSLINSKNRLMTRMVSETVKKNRPMSACYAGSLFGVVKDNGDVFACEQLSTPLGNLEAVDYDLSKIWFSNTASRERRSIANRECHCTYECVSSCNILFNPSNYPALLRGVFHP